MERRSDATNNDELYFLGRCPVCERRYDPDEATLLRDDGELMMVYTDCARCQSSVVFAVARRMGGVVGMVTDMQLSDVRRLNNVGPVTSDDVLGLHEHFVDVS